MKKLFKALIALVIIAGIAFGAYMLFFNKGTDNSQIYTKVTNLNSQETFVKVNDTVYTMITDIEANPDYNIEEIKTYFDVYAQTIKNYDLIKIEIVNNGLFVNSVDTGDSYKQMNSAYEAVVSIYNNAQKYLKDTYWVAPRKAYIENFYNEFKAALKNLNNFYYNAGVSILKCLDNSMTTNNHFKLEIEYYLNLSNSYVKHYLETKENSTSIVALIEAEYASVAGATVDSYLENKLIYDGLYSNASFNKKEVIEKYIAGELDVYLGEIEDEAKKTEIANYCDLVVRG